jgi:hypothetical protein
VIHDPALCIAQSIVGFETNASAPSPAHLSQSRARRGQTLQGEHTVRPPRPRMIREPWAACAAFPAGCLHESRKGEYDDRQQANCRQENHSACGVKRGRHRGYARLVRSRRSSSERRWSPLSSAVLAKATAA